MEDACVQCKEWRETQYWKVFPDNKHHFFKIMLGDFKNCDMRIPRKFKDEFQGKLLDKVILRGPSGNRWTTTLAERGGDFFLQNGWREFVKDHRLNEGDFLVFHNVENSVFDVLIFDPTCCEREDSHFIKKNGNLYCENCHSSDMNTNQQTNRPSDFADDQQRILGQRKKRKGREELTKEEEAQEEEEEEEEAQEEEEEEAQEESQQDIHGTKVRGEKNKKPKDSQGKGTNSKTGDSAYHMASIYVTKGPSCKIPMKPSHVDGSFILTIPKEFANNCLPKTSQYIRLRIGSKSWQVKFNRWKMQCTLTTGWSVFVLENNLNKKDYCVFELANAGTSKQLHILDVHLFRDVKYNVPVVRPPRKCNSLRFS